MEEGYYKYEKKIMQDANKLKDKFTKMKGTTLSCVTSSTYG